MAAVVITPKQLPNALINVLKKYNKLSLKSADKVMSSVGFNMFGGVIEDTPVGINPETIGALKGSWIVTKNSPSSVKRDVRMPNRKRNSIKTQISSRIVSGKIDMYLTSSLPYANVVEFGGYPSPVKKGTRKPEGGFEIRSSGGFSKQAPAGMVRKNALRFNTLVEKAARAL